MALPPAAIRGDWGVLFTALGRYAPALLKTFAQMGPQGALGATKLLGPFSDIVNAVGIKDPFLRSWLDLLPFLLSGLKADGTLAAEVVSAIDSSIYSTILYLLFLEADEWVLFSWILPGVLVSGVCGSFGNATTSPDTAAWWVVSQIYMFSEWYKPGCTLEYPIGGVGAIVDALVRGLEKHQGRLSLGSHVQEIVVEGGRATGVKLRSGLVSSASAKFEGSSLSCIRGRRIWLNCCSLPGCESKEGSDQ